MAIKPAQKVTATGDVREEELAHWVSLVRRLPAVRVDKVVAVREALRNNHYDNEHILAKTIARLGRDIGISLIHNTA